MRTLSTLAELSAKERESLQGRTREVLERIRCSLDRLAQYDNEQRKREETAARRLDDFYRNRGFDIPEAKPIEEVTACNSGDATANEDEADELFGHDPCDEWTPDAIDLVEELEAMGLCSHDDASGFRRCREPRRTGGLFRRIVTAAGLCQDFDGSSEAVTIPPDRPAAGESDTPGDQGSSGANGKPDSQEASEHEGRGSFNPITEVEDCLSGQQLKIFGLLRDRKHWTSFDTLGKQEGFWRKAQPEDATINKALRRLQGDLNAIDMAHITLEIDNTARRTKLVFLDKQATKPDKQMPK